MILISHTAVTLFLAGLIWTIQLVHYPVFSQIPKEEFKAFHAQHCSRIAWLIGPTMLYEFISGLLCLSYFQDNLKTHLLLSINFICIIATWVTTAGFQIPAHKRLEKGYDASAIARLINSNWIRTAFWSLRGLLLTLLLMGMASGFNPQ